MSDDDRVRFEFNITFHGTVGFDDAAEYEEQVRRIDVACKAMFSMSGAHVGGDAPLLADYADALETLANVMRRMRAFSRINHE